MAKTITGTILKGGAGLSGYIVRAYLSDSPHGRKQVGGDQTTDAGGNYSITVFSGLGAVLSRLNDFAWFIVRVYDAAADRMIGETIVKYDLSKDNEAQNFTFTDSDLSGYLVTLGTGTADLCSTDNTVDVFVDNYDIWPQVTAAIQNAKSSVLFTSLLLDPPVITSAFTPDPPAPTGTPVTGTALANAIKDACTKIGCKVRLLVHGGGVLGGYPTDISKDVRSFFDDEWSAGTIEMRFVVSPVSSPLHNKFVIVDDTTAFVLGSPIVQEYYGKPSHSLNEPRWGAYAAKFGQIRHAIHDVSVKLGGSVVGDLRETFRAIWNDTPTTGGTTNTTVDPPATPPKGAGVQHPVQVVRTIPPGLFTDDAIGATGCLDAYLRAIASAEQYIYFENQYFCDPHIFKALQRRLRAKPDLKLIALLNVDVDVPGYIDYQKAACVSLCLDLEKARVGASEKQIGFFSVWSHEIVKNAKGVGRPTLHRRYVHSKTSIIDDKWLTIGSSNLDGTSMDRAQGSDTVWSHPIVPLDPNLRKIRSEEVNVVIAPNGAVTSTRPAETRVKLWSEHLDLDEPSLMTAPPEGWLAKWNEIANQNVADLKSDPTKTKAARVLPLPAYDMGRSDYYYFQELGIDLGDSCDILDHLPSFDFKAGQYSWWVP